MQFPFAVPLAAVLLAMTAASAVAAEDPPEKANPAQRADSAGQVSDAAVTPVSFHQQIKPIFRQHCYGCHQAAKRLGDYQMTDFAALVAGGETGDAAIVPGDPDGSYLLAQITPVDGQAAMPQSAPALNEAEVELVRRWIVEGARNDSPAESEPTYSPENPPRYIGNPPLSSVDVSPDGSTIAVAGFHEVILLDASSGEIRSRLIGMSPRINSVRFSPDGTRLAAVGGTAAVVGEVQIWDVASAQLVLSRQLTYDTLRGASWSPDGAKLAFGAADHAVRAIDVATGHQVLFQGAHEDWVLDTIFTPDGQHIVSVARDMSCKLTEVETERFIDNITSITPGALSGGLSSVARHPQRDEILLGGADGVAKVYRVFRQTQRQIGDDANLVRSLPALPGRIFSVAISPDGSRLAAAATIDGHSEVRVWSYDFDGTLSDELKKILAKRVSSRSAEEKKTIAELRSQPTTELAKLQLNHAAVYAIGFAADNALFVTADDGRVRRLAPDGSLQNDFFRVPLQTDGSAPALAFDASQWTEMASERLEHAAAETLPAAETVQQLIVEPAAVVLESPYAYSQLIVTAQLTDGSQVDVTRLADIEVPGWASVSVRGLVRPVDDGQGHAVVRCAGQTVEVPVVARDISHRDVDFIRDVNPILSRLGCNQGTCHGAQKGKNGFRLSLRGYDPLFDLRSLTDDLAARRINAASPEESLMLRKPLGKTPHQGGTLMAEGDANHTILRRWIASGSKLDLDSAQVDHLDVFPLNPVVQATDARQQVRVIAHYVDGTSRDVTREAFIESGNTDVATTDSAGLLQAVRRGEAPILARFEGAYAATTLTVMGDRSGYREPDVESWNRVDELVAEKWRRMKIVPSDVCDDATFLRRVHLDLTGLPPASDQVRTFLADERPRRTKRSAVVDQLIGSEPFIEYWTNKWADLLQVNRKFLGVEGSKEFRDWIRQAVAENRPYDQFAREILTATGSNRENPAASYFKILRTPEDTMENTTHLFMGVRFNCNKCHDHPFERWTQDQYYELSAFFARVGLERDPASGDRNIGGSEVEGAKPLFEDIVDRDAGEVQYASTGESAEPKFPFPVEHQPPSDGTRRQRLATWMTDADNPYFARSYVNRLWGYLLDAGLIEPIDDIRAGNPPTNPKLLDHLTESFVDSGFDMRQMLRMICNSRTYQLSIETNPLNEDDSLNYSHALARRLPAEVIYDAVHAVTGSTSDIPGVPKGTRAAELSDSGVKLADGFLQSLGRPARESVCECERSSGLQLGPVMALISGPTIGSAIADPKNDLEQLVADLPDDKRLVEEIFLRALGRHPSESELTAFQQISGQIGEDHQRLVERLQKAEAAWAERRAKLETERQQKLAETSAAIEARQEAIKAQRAKLEAQRQERIAEAEKKLAETRQQLDGKIKTWRTQQQQTAVEWFPLTPSSLAATTDSTLVPLADRSILSTGKRDKGVYTVQFRTSLRNISGFRLEMIADPSLPSSGPGLGENGNFVLTELEIEAAPLKSPSESAQQTIASGIADFLQGGFAIEQTFDGKMQDQGGWAVAGATGVVHWATFKLAQPIQHEGGSLLTFKLHQFHNATDHRIGRFRISATTAGGEIPLDISESLAAALAADSAARSDEAKTLLSDYLGATDKDIQAAQAALASAREPLPPDAQLVALQTRRDQLSKPTPDDPKLAQLRQNVRQSGQQRKQIRLTAAEDLTWALINSPAFLFNH